MSKKNKIILVIVIILLLVLGIIGWILFDLWKPVEYVDHSKTNAALDKLEKKYTFGFVGYEIKEDTNTIEVTLYGLTEPIKSIFTYTFKNDKISNINAKHHYSNKMEALSSSKEGPVLNTKIEGNIVINDLEIIEEDKQKTKQEYKEKILQTYSNLADIT